MANIGFALKKTTVDALNVISASSHALSAAADSVAALAETASAHAQDYRDTSIADLEASRKERRIISSYESRISVAERLRSVEQRLSADPKLAAVYLRIGKHYGDESPLLSPLNSTNSEEPRSSNLSVAAE